MTGETVQVNVHLTPAQLKEVDAIHEHMQKTFEGIKVARSDAVRHMILRDRRPEARLVHVNLSTLSADIANALATAGYEPDRITETLTAVRIAHEQVRSEQAEKLGVTVSDINEAVAQ